MTPKITNQHYIFYSPHTKRNEMKPFSLRFYSEQSPIMDARLLTRPVFHIRLLYFVHGTLRLFTVRFGVNKQQNPHTLLHLIYPRNYTHVHTRITTSDWYDHSCVTGVRQKFEARECQEKRINTTIQARC